MDYQSLSIKMDELIELAQKVKAECAKATPSHARLSEYADEDLSHLSTSICNILYAAYNHRCNCNSLAGGEQSVDPIFEAMYRVGECEDKTRGVDERNLHSSL